MVLPSRNLISEKLTVEQADRLLDGLVQSRGETGVARQAALQLMVLVRLKDTLPGVFAPYAAMIHDGIVYFLSHVSFSRLRQVLLEQITLPADCQPGQRLMRLALSFPTLHKLGQIIARHQGVPLEQKGWLVELENGLYGADIDSQAQVVTEELEKLDRGTEIEVMPQILAEASVATVLPFTMQNDGKSTPIHGVFKLLKPGVQKKLQEELQVMGEAIDYLEGHRADYGFPDLRLSSLYREISDDMVKEIDLEAEQANLLEAGRIYGSMDRVVIPALFPLCTKTMTAMQRVKGVKITEVAADSLRRADLARLLFEAVLCRPLFLHEDRALFHGDPHAGNIMAVQDGSAAPTRIALLDWTLADYLGKEQRSQMVELMIGSLTENVQKTASSIKKLAVPETEEQKLEHSYLTELIRECSAVKAYQQSGPLKRTFLLLEKLTLKGIVFPAELILYRKSFFTLEGVLGDVSPGFDMENVMQEYLIRLLLLELPMRYSTWFLPRRDDGRLYQTMMSNRDLRNLTLHQAMEAWQQIADSSSILFKTQMDFYSSYLDQVSKLFSLKM